MTGPPRENIVPGDVGHIGDSNADNKLLNLQGFRPESWGAVGDGMTDDTAAMLSAWTACTAANRPLILSGGKNYVYNGAGLDTWTTPTVIGPGAEQVTVTLGATSYFLSLSAQTEALLVKGIKFDGGKGVWRSTVTGVHVGGLHRFEDVYASGYTQAAFYNMASDFPYISFDHCRFYGANYTTTMGVALSGLTDACTFTHCDFLANRVHIKLAQGGNSCYIDKCDFLRLGATAGSPRIDVWVMPDPVGVNDGSGLVITSANKFGNEFLDAADLRIVYADQGTGTDFGSKFPDLTTESTGLIGGHRIGGTFICNGANADGWGPLVYSMVPFILNCTYSNITIAGTPPSYIVQFLNTVPTLRTASNNENVIGPVMGTLAGGFFYAPKATNVPGMFRNIIDPQGLFAAFDPRVPNAYPGANPVDLVDTGMPGVRTMGLGGGVTRNNIADGYGGIDAAEFVFTGAGQVASGGVVGAPTEGSTYWVEFDLAAGSSSPLTGLRFQIIDFASNIYLDLSVTVPPTWEPFRVRMPWKGPAPAGGGWGYAIIAPAAGKVYFGRVRIYASRDPQNIDGKLGKPGAMIHLGAGVPDAGLGTDGDFYFRTDGAAASKTTLYHREGGSWVTVDQ